MLESTVSAFVWDLSLLSKLALVAFTFLVCFALSKLASIAGNASKLPLPPGPNGLPLIGNLLDLLAAAKEDEQHLLFEKWSRTYGELYKVKIGPFTQYMVNSDIAVKQVFDKPAGVSANRPPWLVSGQHICNGWNVLLINGDLARWKHQRKVTWGNVGSIPRADAGLPFLHYDTLKFLHEVVNDVSIQNSGKALWTSIMRYTYSNFATQMLGMDVPNSNDPAIHYIHETGITQILGTLPGAHLVDIFPIIDRLPLFLKPWERAGRERFQRDLNWCLDKLKRVHAMSDRSAIRESLLCKLVEDENDLGFSSEEEGAYFCLMLTIGAADTSQISTWAFVEAMLEFPEVQSKARKEINQKRGRRSIKSEEGDRSSCRESYT